MSARLVAAFCTRDRPDDLMRAAESLAASARASGGALDAVLIVDGGALPEARVASLRDALSGAATSVEHIRAAGPGSSLFRSRLLALARGRELGADYVAFFDDDAELDSGYIGALRATLAREPAAVGGIDTLRPASSAGVDAWRRFAGLSSGEAGRLSASGFAESQHLWAARREAFESDYLSGCNMTLSTRVLDAIPQDAAEHFATYSLGEDYVLSAAARRLGSVIVDPAMRVAHHQSPTSREGRYETGRQLVSNLMWMKRRGMGARSAGALAWSLGWIFARALLGDARGLTLQGKAAGMLAGLREGMRDR